MKLKFLIILGILLVGVFILIKFPASAVLSAQKMQQVGLEAEQVSGTVWQGKIQAVKYRNINLDELNWQLTPLDLAFNNSIGNISLKLNDSWLNARVKKITKTAIELEAVKGEMQIVDVLEIAKNYKPFIVPFAVSGKLQLNFANVEFDRVKKTGSANGALEFTGLNVGGQKVQGKYIAQIKSHNQNLKFDLVNTNGADLSVKASGILNNNGSYELSGKLAPTAATSQQIMNLLQFIGIRDKNQSRDFSQSGRI